MSAAVLANLVLLVHAAFIAWACLGALAVWRWPCLAWLHLPALAWAVGIEWSGGICPLTPIEWRLREAAGQQGHGGGFIEQYLIAAIYPEGLTREIQWLLGGLLLLFNVVVYGLMLRRRIA